VVGASSKTFWSLRREEGPVQVNRSMSDPRLCIGARGCADIQSRFLMTQDQNTQARTYSAAHFGLELDGLPNVGLFRSIEGGSIKTDVMSTSTARTTTAGGQLGKPKFEDIKIRSACR